MISGAAALAKDGTVIDVTQLAGNSLVLFTWAEALSDILRSLSVQFLTGIKMKPVLQLKTCPNLPALASTKDKPRQPLGLGTWFSS